MRLRPLSRRIATVVALFGLMGVAKPQTTAAPAAADAPKPLILEKEQGELRTRRLHTDKSTVASSQFLLKVSPKNNGSQHLVLGTEELAPKARIAKHKHLAQDEILLIQSGSAHV